MRPEFVAYCALLIPTFASPQLTPAAPNFWRLDAQLVTPTSAWATYDNRLLWTNDAGGSWNDVTPSLDPQEAISSAFFLPTAVGWVTISTGGDRFNRLILASTSDGGLTWHKSSVTAANRLLSRGPMSWAGNSYLFFSDLTHGWVELQRMSSSNFKDGILLATNDGGKN